MNSTKLHSWKEEIGNFYPVPPPPACFLFGVLKLQTPSNQGHVILVIRDFLRGFILDFGGEVASHAGFAVPFYSVQDCSQDYFGVGCENYVPSISIVQKQKQDDK